MNHKMYSIFDQKAHAYLPPFFLPTEGMALRTFTDCCNDKTHQFGQHPEDYTLVELGSFDDIKGVVNPHDVTKVIAMGLELIDREERDGRQLSLVPDTNSQGGPDYEAAKETLEEPTSV